MRPKRLSKPAQENGSAENTYVAFEVIDKIKKTPQMSSVYCVVRAGKAIQNFKGRKIGVCRAYLAKAMEYGLDAAFCDVAFRFGMVAPDAGLLKLLDAYAKMDGSASRKENLASMMS